MKRVEFYVGVFNRDINEFKEFVNSINEIFPENDHIELKNEFDDPDGYYTFTCVGSWETYEVCRQWPRLKSIEHFEDDN